jgi:hypothetical protein
VRYTIIKSVGVLFSVSYFGFQFLGCGEFMQAHGWPFPVMPWAASLMRLSRDN